MESIHQCIHIFGMNFHAFFPYISLTLESLSMLQKKEEHEHSQHNVTVSFLFLLHETKTNLCICLISFLGWS